MGEKSDFNSSSSSSSSSSSRQPSIRVINYNLIDGCPQLLINNIDEIHNVSIKASFTEKISENTSLAFTIDLMSMVNLACTTKEECLNKFIIRTFECTINGKISKNSGIFTKDEVKFIEQVSKL